MIGGNYQKSTTSDDSANHYSGTNSGIGPRRYYDFHFGNKQSVESYATFGGLDYELSQNLTLQGSLRYTWQQNNFNGCLWDSGDGRLAAAFSLVASSALTAGQCVVLDPITRAPVNSVTKNLDEENLSWRLGLNWKVTPGTLVYANITRGYKAGTFSLVPGLDPKQYDPVGQESLLAYELGLKTSLGRNASIAAAAFYYDYSNKQLVGTVATFFGPLAGMVSVPKSEVIGGEINFNLRPAEGLTTSLSATYVKSRVTSHYMTPDKLGAVVDIFGETFPSTPEWQLSGNVEYRFPLSASLEAFVGANASYQSASKSSFGQNRIFFIGGYGLLDLRAGVESGNWRAEIWGRNVTNQFYVTNVAKMTDTVARMTGMPATYGITLKYKFN